MSNQFENLMNEVAAINARQGTVGSLEALIYIRDNIMDYIGTAIEPEFREFMRLGSKMFYG